MPRFFSCRLGRICFVKTNPLILLIVAVALLGWGVFHAVGAARKPGGTLQAVLVIGCMVAFVGFWGTMLWSRSKRLQRQAARRAENPPTSKPNAQ